MNDPLLASLEPIAELRPPTLAEILDARRRRQTRRTASWAGLGTLAAAALALVVFIPANNTASRTKGGVAPADLQLQVAVVGSAGTRAYAGGPVSLADQLVFRIDAAEAGRLRITEHSASGMTTVVDTRTPTGPFTPGGASPLGWRPDAGTGTYRYQIEHCAVSRAVCSERLVEVRWVP